MRYLIFTLVRIIEKIPLVRLYQVIEFDKVSFLMIPKSGTRSIRDARLMLDGVLSGDSITVFKKNLIVSQYYRFLTLKQLDVYIKKKEVYYVYRSWDERVKSCWRQKIKHGSGYYFWMYYPFIRPKISEEDFSNFVQKLPEPLREKHFSSYADLTLLSDLKRIDLSNLDSILFDLVGKEVRSNVTNS